MKARIWTAACTAIALGVSVGLLAQEAPAPQTPAQGAAAKTITVAGCVAKAEPGPTGTSGAAGAASEKATKFVLSNASMSPAGTAGTAGAAPATAIASEYRLDGDDAKLTPHVGHKVEITGSVEQPKGATEAPAASAANSPKLKVDSVKMIAPSCQ